jgi:hypothetical protein
MKRDHVPKELVLLDNYEVGANAEAANGFKGRVLCLQELLLTRPQLRGDPKGGLASPVARLSTSA